MDSIQNTHRQISKVSISFGFNTPSRLIRESAISDAVKIVKKFSATIKYFELEFASLEMSDFLQILSLLPNAEHLVFNNVFDKKQSETHHQPSNIYLNLHQLKTLELRICNSKFQVVFNGLPADVLKKITLGYCTFNLGLLTGLFAHQSNIKELILIEDDDAESHDNTLPDHIFDHLNLDSLECQQNEYNSRHATILSRQTRLKHLKLRGRRLDREILNVITNQLSELESLDIDFNETLVVPFKSIVKLKNLKHLTLKSCSLKLIETFAGLDNSRITTLKMEVIYTWDDDDDDGYPFPAMPVNLIGALANSLPNLKALQFDYECELEAIIAIMQYFNFIEALEMKYDQNIDAKLLSETIEVGRCFNPELTELEIAQQFPCEESLLTKLIAIYPNVKKLDITFSSSTSFTTSQLKVILNGFKKMESLSLHFDTRLNFTTEYLNCIRDHKNLLKSITLSHIEFTGELALVHVGYGYEFASENEEKFRAVLDVIRYTYGTLHMAYKTIVNSI